MTKRGTTILESNYPAATGMLEAGLRDASEGVADQRWYRRVLRAAWLVAGGIMDCIEALELEGDAKP